MEFQLTHFHISLSLSLSLTRAYTQNSAIVSRKMEVRARKKAINNKKNSARQVDFKILLWNDSKLFLNSSLSHLFIYFPLPHSTWIKWQMSKRTNDSKSCYCVCLVYMIFIFIVMIVRIKKSTYKAARHLFNFRIRTFNFWIFPNFSIFILEIFQQIFFSFWIFRGKLFQFSSISHSTSISPLTNLFRLPHFDFHIHPTNVDYAWMDLDIKTMSVCLLMLACVEHVEAHARRTFI